MTKKISISLFFLLSTSVAFAQIGESRSDLALGVNAGVGLNTISFDPTIKQHLAAGSTFGVTFRYTCEKYFKSVCALQVELNYARLGWSENILSAANQPLPDTYRRSQDYIQLPMLARLGWGKEQRGWMFFVLAGPQVGYCFKEKSSRSETWSLDSEGNPDRPNNLYAQYSMSIKHKFDYGITGGLGVECSTSVGHFMMEGRYYYGLSDVFGNSKKDIFSRSANGTIIGKITYLFSVK